jgi:plastocyanin
MDLSISESGANSQGKEEDTGDFARYQHQCPRRPAGRDFQARIKQLPRSSQTEHLKIRGERIMRITFLASGVVLLAALLAPAAAATTYDVDIAGFAFDPDTLTIVVGDTVRWTNSDAAPHTATSNTGVFDSGTLATGDQFSYTFDQVGSYPYFCSIHPSMTAVITVADPSLSTDVSSLSAAFGGSVAFTLDAGPAFAGRLYGMTGSASGFAPGTLLPGGGVLPLNQDFVFDFIRRSFGSPMLTDFTGTLDANGQAFAMLEVFSSLPAALPPGTTLHFAFTTVNPYDFQSNPVSVDIVP